MQTSIVNIKNLSLQTVKQKNCYPNGIAGGEIRNRENQTEWAIFNCSSLSGLHPPQLMRLLPAIIRRRTDAGRFAALDSFYNKLCHFVEISYDYSIFRNHFQLQCFFDNAAIPI